MAEFRIRVDLAGVMSAAGNVINAQVLPRLNQAVRAVVAQTQADWMESVQRARGLWSGEKDAYAASIQAKMTGDFSGLVWTDYKYAEEIENGRPAKDLKSMLDTSLKVRTTKKGKRYLIIPMRHNTPGSDALAPAMPPSIFAAVSQLAASRVTGMGSRVSGTGAMDPKTRQAVTVPQRRYSWGDRLVGAVALGGNKNHEGMYRFSTTTPGGARSSAYLTFRVMMEGSPGWVVAPRPGLGLARGVAERMQPLAELAFGEAVKIA
jgi:hypothetical protein